MKTIKTSFTASGYLLYFKSAILGILCGSASIVMIILLLSAVLLISGTIPHNIIIWLTVVACALGSFVAGHTSARITKHNALFTGLLSGGCLFMILSSAGLIFGNNFTYITLIKLASIILFSVFGAIKAVNKKEKLHIK